MNEYLDPTAPVAVPRKTARRPSSLDGLVVTLLDISKRSEEHTSELQSPCNLVCRLLLEKKKQTFDLVPRRSRDINPLRTHPSPDPSEHIGRQQPENVPCAVRLHTTHTTADVLTPAKSAL